MRSTLVLLLLLVACQSKDVTCKETAILIPGYIGFYGFSRSDLDTMIISKYEADRSFSKLSGVDTMIDTNIYEENGYLYPDKSKGSFTSIDPYNDIIITLPSISKIYYIHAAYRPPDTIIWTEESGCRERTFIQGPDTIYVNNTFLRDTDSQHQVYIQP